MDDKTTVGMQSPILWPYMFKEPAHCCKNKIKNYSS